MPDTSVLDVKTLDRPRPELMRYYALASLLTGPAFPVLLTLNYFRYRTLRYRFDDEGISMSWGVLFRREIHLAYARIQDIHLQSNVVERHLGLARIEIQTASGSSKAEMTIEGLREYSALRDFLYSRMRGAAGKPTQTGAETPRDELAETLSEVARELRAIREKLEGRA